MACYRSKFDRHCLNMLRMRETKFRRRKVRNTKTGRVGWGLWLRMRRV